MCWFWIFWVMAVLCFGLAVCGWFAGVGARRFEEARVFVLWSGGFYLFGLGLCGLMALFWKEWL